MAIRILRRLVLVTFAGGALALGGCSPGAVADRMPEAMGLPSNAPARPTTPYNYPAVHDMPAQRPARTLTEAEQDRLERELAAARERQRGQNAAADKKKPSAANPAQAGARSQ